MTTNDKTPDTGTEESHAEVVTPEEAVLVAREIMREARVDPITLTVRDEQVLEWFIEQVQMRTPDTGTPPAEVEALIDALHRELTHTKIVEKEDRWADHQNTISLLARSLQSLRTLTARIAELEGEYRELDGVMQSYIAAAEAAGRTKCVAELREVQRKWEKLADESYSGQDLAAGRRFESISHGWRNAADHLEANGREQG